MTVVDIMVEGCEVPLRNTLSFDQFMQLYRTGRYGDQKVLSIEIVQKHHDKGPNRIVFE